MIFHVSRCDSIPHPVEDLLRDNWERQTYGHTIRWWKAQSQETHPQLLKRIFTEIQAKPDYHVVSELDMILFPGAPERIARDLKHLGAIFASFENRTPDGHRLDHWPLVGPWLMAFNTVKLKNRPWPEFDWLDTIDKPFDVANPSLVYLLESGYLRPYEAAFFQGEDERTHSGMYATRYPGIGVHAFYGRCFSADDESQLGNIEGATVGSHIAGIKNLLLKINEGVTV